MLRKMGKTASFDRRALADLLRKQNCLVARGQAIGCAMSEGALRHRIRIDGPWQVVLPGVYLGSTGNLTWSQREMAALLYAGPEAAISGPAALAWHGIRVQRTDVVDVLVPARRKRQDIEFVRLHRIEAMPRMIFPEGEIRYVPPARAVADTVRGLRGTDEVRAVVAAAVQRGKVQVWQLAEELSRGPARGSARLRRALAEVADGVRSVAEADLRSLIKRKRLPDPLYNPRLYVGEEFLAVPDAWWPDAGVAAEADSRQWHLSPRDWEQTLARHSRMSAAGIIVLHYPPSRHCYISFLRWSRSKMFPSTLRRPVSQARAKLPGSAAIDTTTSLFAVNRTWAARSPFAASLTGSAPCCPSLVTKVTPRSGTRQLSVLSMRWAARSWASTSEMRAVSRSNAVRHSSAVAIMTSLSRSFSVAVPLARRPGARQGLQVRRVGAGGR